MHGPEQTKLLLGVADQYTRTAYQLLAMAGIDPNDRDCDPFKNIGEMVGNGSLAASGGICTNGKLVRYTKGTAK